MLQIVQFLWMDFFISARLVRAFVCSYPMDGILRASEQCCCPVNRIPIEISRAFTVQSRLCYRKHRSLKHHPYFRAMINLQPCIRRPRCDKSRANSTPRRPCCQQQAPLPTSTQHAPRPTSCSRLTLQQTSSQTLLQGLLPSWSILIFVRPSSHTPLARSFLVETTALPSQTTSKKFDLQKHFSGDYYTTFFKLDNFETVWPSGDFRQNLHFSSSLVVYSY